MCGDNASLDTHFDILSNHALAAEMMMSSVQRCSDALFGNTPFLADLRTMSHARDQIAIYQNSFDSPKEKLREIEKLVAENMCEEASSKLFALKSHLKGSENSILRTDNFNSAFWTAKMKVLEGQILIKDTGCNGQIPNVLMDGLIIAKQNRFRSLEMVALFELGKYWLSKVIAADVLR